MSRIVRQLTFLGALGLLFVPIRGDSNDVTAELCRLAPQLNPRVAYHLVADDDAQFRTFARDVGINQIKDALMTLDYGLSTDSREAYRRTSRALLPYMARVGAAITSEYGCTEAAREVAFRTAVGDSGLEFKLLRYGLDSLQNNAAMPFDEKRRRYGEFVAQCQRLGSERLIVAIDGSLARDVMQTGDLAARGRYLRSALAGARRLDECLMMCQFLGELGDLYGIEGDRDSMMLCFLEGIAIADRHRIPEQAARLRLFLASHYVEEGRLALAGDLLRDAQISCRRFGGGPFEVRSVLQSMNLFADLACWEIVRNQWYRLPVLLRGLKRAGRYPEHARYALDAELWTARLLARSGAPARAAAIMTSLLGKMRSTHGREAVALVHEERARALLEAGDVQGAMAAVAKGLAYADSFHTPAEAADLATIRVRAALASRDLDFAAAALAEARRRAAQPMATGSAPASNAAVVSCTHDALEARIALARGDRRQAVRAIDRALGALRRHLAEQDGSPPSYLIPGQIDELRIVAHEVLDEDVDAGLRLELFWRSLPSWLDRQSMRNGGIAPGRPEPRELRSLRVVYATTSSGVVRWTRNGAEWRREVLPCSASECEHLVARFMRLVSLDPIDADSPPPAELRALADRLGTWLLPADLRRGARVRVVISAEGQLARLPFEALDIADGAEYVPVLALHDVAYARPVAPRSHRPGNGSSLFLIGALDDNSGAGSASMGGLNAVENEIATAKLRLPSGPVLRNTAVPKREVLAAFSGASVVYIAAHQARDAQVPLFAYFPMSFEARPATLEDRYLDLRDMRDVDFSRCDLTVLSSCASGEPYVVNGRSGPSMADVILDAGADAVIHTRWRVRDDQAAKVAPELAGNWVRARSRVEAVAAWSAARRAMIRGSRGTRHPFGWAAWSVTLAEVTPPWPEPEQRLIARARPGGIARPAVPPASRSLAGSLRTGKGVRP
jgi:tetratricopeptide (TPR) repeat protein